jgi:long-chain acyl-CoA synthetase
MNLHAALGAVARRQPEHPAIVWGEEEVSYGALWERTLGWNRRLHHELAVQPGDRVAIWLKNRPELAQAIFGVWQAGGVVVMINHFQKPDEITYILKDSGARVVITEAEFREAAARVADRLSGLRFLHIEEPVPPDAAGLAPVPRSESDLAALLYTSGTTGHPKGAMLSHGNLLHNVRSCLQCLEVTPADRLVVLLPQFHSFMFTVGTLMPLLAGASVLLFKSLSPMKSVLEEILRRRATILPAVPSFWRALTQMPMPPDWPLRLCVSGGAALPVEVLREFEAKFSSPLIEGYGPTESSPVATVNPIHGPRKAGSVGRPVPDVELSIRDDAGRELPVGATGEICIRGGNVMLGYWNQPEETAKTIRDGWLYTGDIGHRDEDGFFYITDRKKDMVIVNGINVYPRQVEEVMYQFPGVREAAVVGIPDPRRGEQPVGFVVLNEGATLDPKALLVFLRERLADYKVPRALHLVSALPRNATGKVLKTQLRDLARKLTSGPAAEPADEPL